MKTVYPAAVVVALLMVATAAWLTPPVPIDEPALTDQYDHRFKKYNKRYFSILSDWRWFKAQSVAESGLRKNAQSEKGAVGVMQVLPDTFSEVVDHYPHLYNIADPKWNVAAGVAFNRYLYERWIRWVPPDQSLKFTLASYNSGLRRMTKAKARAAADGHDSNDWKTVAPYAPRQTRRYVRRIHELMGYAVKPK